MAFLKFISTVLLSVEAIDLYIVALCSVKKGNKFFICSLFITVSFSNLILFFIPSTIWLKISLFSIELYFDMLSMIIKIGFFL